MSKKKCHKVMPANEHDRMLYKLEENAVNSLSEMYELIIMYNMEKKAMEFMEEFEEFSDKAKAHMSKTREQLVEKMREAEAQANTMNNYIQSNKDKFEVMSQEFEVDIFDFITSAVNYNRMDKE